MTDGLFNIARASLAEKFRDGAANGIVLVLEANEAEGTLRDYDDLAALLTPAGNTEWSATNYARKTGLTGTITVDDSNDRTDTDIPDQTWSGVTGSASTKLVVAYEESASDSGRVPLTDHDFATTPDGSDITAQFAASGFARSS